MVNTNTNKPRITDCCFQPATMRLTVEEVVKTEKNRCLSGQRHNLPVDDWDGLCLDPETWWELGYREIAIADHETPSGLAIKAIQHLLNRNGLSPQEIDGFYYYNTNPWLDELHINIAGKIAESTGMTHLQTQLHLSQRNCTSALFALETACHALMANPDHRWFVIAGADCVDLESGQPRIVMEDILGDAGSAALIGWQGTSIRCMQNIAKPVGWQRFMVDQKTKHLLALNYLKWSLTQINDALQLTGLDIHDLAFLSTNQELVDQYWSAKFGVAPDKLGLGPHVAKYGHTVAHEMMHALAHIMENNITEGSLLHATGLGTSFSTLIL